MEARNIYTTTSSTSTIIPNSQLYIIVDNNKIDIRSDYAYFLSIYSHFSLKFLPQSQKLQISIVLERLLITITMKYMSNTQLEFWIMDMQKYDCLNT